MHNRTGCWYNFSRDGCCSLQHRTTFIIYCINILCYYKYLTWINVHWHCRYLCSENLCSQSGKCRQLWNILSNGRDDWCQCNFIRNYDDWLFWILTHRHYIYILGWMWYQGISINECHCLQYLYSNFCTCLDIHEWWYYCNCLNFQWFNRIMWLE